MHLKKIPFDNCRDLIKRFDFSQSYEDVGLEHMEPYEVMMFLSENQQMVDFINFITHALPVREAVCWGYNVMVDVGHRDNTRYAKVLDHVRQWVKEPAEMLHSSLMELSESIDNDSPPGWLARAVVWGGLWSIVESDKPVVMPPDFLYSKALLGAVALLLDGHEESIGVVLEASLDNALLVGNGHWPKIFEDGR